LLSYEQEGIKIDDLQAINLTAVVGDKGGSTRESFLSCDNAKGGVNVVTAAFMPRPNSKITALLSCNELMLTHVDRMYVAFEDGTGDSHVPGCCNNYIQFDMDEWFGRVD
jgi:hypothetical protein